MDWSPRSAKVLFFSSYRTPLMAKWRTSSSLAAKSGSDARRLNFRCLAKLFPRVLLGSIRYQVPRTGNVVETSAPMEWKDIKSRRMSEYEARTKHYLGDACPKPTAVPCQTPIAYITSVANYLGASVSEQDVKAYFTFEGSGKRKSYTVFEADKFRTDYGLTLPQCKERSPSEPDERPKKRVRFSEPASVARAADYLARRRDYETVRRDYETVKVIFDEAQAHMRRDREERELYRKRVTLGLALAPDEEEQYFAKAFAFNLRVERVLLILSSAVHALHAQLTQAYVQAVSSYYAGVCKSGGLAPSAS